MSVTKYVINDKGEFALVSKYAGMEHATLQQYIDGPVVRAGFVVLYKGKLETYGNSVTMGLKSGDEDGPTIQAALEAGQVHKVMDNACFNPSYVATSDPAAAPHAEGVTSMEDLVALKVLVND